MSSLQSPRDLPILYSGPMVRAILAKMKRMTRRLSGLEIVNLDPDAWELRDVDNLGTAIFSLMGKIGDSVKGKPGHHWTTDRISCKSRHGGVGDTHWIRETWAAVHAVKDFETGHVDDWTEPKSIPKDNKDGFWTVLYAADSAFDECVEDRGFRWRPGIHMPRWASRISTRVTSVKVERLQSIPWYDIKAEGIACPEHDGPGVMCCSECPSLRDAFVKLWDGINPDMPYAFDPWVRCTSFELIETQHA